MCKIRHLDLFSGIGGFSLAARWAYGKEHEVVAFCEIDKYCQKVLKKHWPDVPIFEDVRSLDGKQFKDVDLISGGFPCQPFSHAGQRKGKGDDRHLWPEYLRIIQEARPRWVIGENVSGIINMELDTVLSDLEGEDYTCQAIVIPACAVNAYHRRDRVWIVGYAEHFRQLTAKVSGGTSPRSDDLKKRAEQAGEFERSGQQYEDVAHSNSSGIAQSGLQQASLSSKPSETDVADPGGIESRRVSSFGWEEIPEAGGSSKDASETNSQGVEGCEKAGNIGTSGQNHNQLPGGLCSITGHWTSETLSDTTSERLPDWTGGEMGQPFPVTEFERPSGREIERDFCGMAHGVFKRVDRLKALGNAIVPQVAFELLRIIRAIDEKA